MMKMKRSVCFFLLTAVILFSMPISACALDIPGYLKPGFQTDIIELTDDSLPALLAEYAAIVGQLWQDSKGHWDDDCYDGCISDLDGDSFPELALVYSTDGTDTLEVQLLCRTAEGNIRRMKCQMGSNAGSPRVQVSLSRPDGRTLFHVSYANVTRAIYRVGVETVIELSKGELTPVHTLKWIENMTTREAVYEADGKEDQDAFARIHGAIEEQLCVYGYDGTPMTELQYQILHYKA